MRYYEERVVKGGGSLCIETLSYRVSNLTSFINIFGWSELGIVGAEFKDMFESTLHVMLACFSTAVHMRSTTEKPTSVPVLQKLLDSLTKETATKALGAFDALERFFFVQIEEKTWRVLRSLLERYQ